MGGVSGRRSVSFCVSCFGGNFACQRLQQSRDVRAFRFRDCIKILLILFTRGGCQKTCTVTLKTDRSESGLPSKRSPAPGYRGRFCQMVARGNALLPIIEEILTNRSI